MWICAFFFFGARVVFGTVEEEEEAVWLFAALEWPEADELGAG